MRAAIVTGTSRGLGKAFAEKFLKDGYQVFGFCRSESELSSQENYQHEQVDFVEMAEAERRLVAVCKKLSGEALEEVLLLNAAATVEPIGVIGSLDGKRLAQAYAVNLITPALFMNVFCREFGKKSFPAKIISLCSGAAKAPLPGTAVYASSKAGIEALTVSVAKEYKGTNISCIAVRPGVVDTGMQELLRSQDEEKLPSVGKYQMFKDDGYLRSAEDVSAAIFEKCLRSEVENGSVVEYTELGLW